MRIYFKKSEKLIFGKNINRMSGISTNQRLSTLSIIYKVNYSISS